MITEPRPYHDESDFEKMKALLIAGRRAGTRTYYAHIGDLSWWLYYILSAHDRSEIAYLWEGAGGDLLGWSLLSPQAFDLFVHPDERGSPQADHMLAWTVEQGVKRIREQGGKDVATLWIAEGDDVMIPMLERLGLARQDAFLYLLSRPLDAPIPDPPLPEGYQVRHVAGDDESAARAIASYEAFQSSMPFEQYLARYRRFRQSPVYTPELDLVTAAPDGGVGAFCICWIDPVNQVGLFEPVGTRPAFQRRGLGKAVVCEGLRRLKARGMTTAIVGAESDNPAAQRLYESAGFRVEKKLCTYARDV